MQSTSLYFKTSWFNWETNEAVTTKIDMGCISCVRSAPRAAVVVALRISMTHATHTQHTCLQVNLMWCTLVRDGVGGALGQPLCNPSPPPPLNLHAVCMFAVYKLIASIPYQTSFLAGARRVGVQHMHGGHRLLPTSAGVAVRAVCPNAPLHAEFIEGGVIFDSKIQGNLWFSPTDFNGSDTITVKRVINCISLSLPRSYASVAAWLLECLPGWYRPHLVHACKARSHPRTALAGQRRVLADVQKLPKPDWRGAKAAQTCKPPHDRVFHAGKGMPGNYRSACHLARILCRIQHMDLTTARASAFGTITQARRKQKKVYHCSIRI